MASSILRLPSALAKRRRVAGHVFARHMAADHTPALPLKTVGILGAPLVEGQNLLGADLAPRAMREAGLVRLLEKVGKSVEDWGDLDFHRRFRELGLEVDPGRENQGYQLWEEWMAKGCQMNYSEFVAVAAAKEKAAAAAAAPADTQIEVRQIKIDAAVDCSGFIDQAKRNDSLEAAQRDVYNEVVNSHLMGAGLGYLYDKCLEIVKKGQLLFTIGGDHSIATATIAASSRVHKDLCVIWIDAHADANTPETSPSLHYHGMPVAHLLGWFKRHPPGFQEWMPELQCLREQNFAYIGLRDIDPVEGSMLRKSDLHLFTMREVDKFGVASCVEQALQRIDPQGNRPIHLSLDVDGIDPSCAPGTGTQARGGLSYREIHYICEEVALTGRLVSMDLVEINPGLDRLQGQPLHGDDPDLKTTTQTVQLGVELALSALGKTILGDAKPQAEDGATGSVPASVIGPAPSLGGAPSAPSLNGA